MTYAEKIAEKLATVAEGQQAVYDKGCADGAKSEYDAFWDAFQENGNRKDYRYAFYCGFWDITSFKPKYDIVPTDATSLFQNNGNTFDLAEHLKNCGVNLDLSNCTGISYAFYTAGFTRLPVINLTSVANLTRAFGSSSYLKTIDKVILKSDGSQGLRNGFDYLGALENITFEGMIGDSLDLHWSTKLTHDSLMSIINALKSGVSGLTCTLGTENLAKLTDAEKAIATEKGWTLA